MVELEGHHSAQMYSIVLQKVTDLSIVVRQKCSDWG